MELGIMFDGPIARKRWKIVLARRLGQMLNRLMGGLQAHVLRRVPSFLGTVRDTATHASGAGVAAGLPLDGAAPFALDELQFSMAVADCLEALESGQSTVEDCLARYPQYEQMRVLLYLALMIRAVPYPKPDPVWFAASRRRIEAARMLA